MKDPAKRYIVFFVCAVHLLFVFVLLFSSPIMTPKKQRKPMSVKTTLASSPVIQTPIKRTAEKTAPSAAAVSAPVKKEAPRTAPSAKPQKTANPVKKAPAAAPVTKAPQTPQKSQVPAALLKELESSIAKLETRDSPKPSPKRSTAISRALQIDAPEIALASNAAQDTDYVSLLTQQLHEALNLPELGEVKIELTLRQDGSVAKLLVLKAESAKNKKYLEEHLHALRFPHLKGSYAKQKECAFVLTFCNEL